MNRKLKMWFVSVGCLVLGCKNYPVDKSFNWAEIEMKASNKDKINFLKSVDDPILDGSRQAAIENGNDEGFELFHLIDLNEDKEIDVIYNGYGGAADEFVMVFINSKGVLKKRFHDYGKVQSVKAGKAKTSFEIFRPLLMGEEGLDSIKVFQVDGDILKNVKTTAVPM